MAAAPPPPGSVEPTCPESGFYDNEASAPVVKEPRPATSTLQSFRPHFLTGMINDLKTRLPIYLDDWKKPDNITRVFNSTFYAFVVQLIPALVFAQVLNRQTEGNLATSEVLISTGIVGILYAVLAGQPLTLLGIAGPTALLLGKSYSLAAQFHASYFSFYWWIIFWAAVMHGLTALWGGVDWVWRITPFTTQIFEFFIGLTFCYEAIRDLVSPIRLGQTSHDENGRAAAYATVLIGIGTFYICWTLHFAETWPNFTTGVRGVLTSYNMMIALIFMTALSYLPGVDLVSSGNGGIGRVDIRGTIPYNWEPTNSSRSWWTDPFGGIDSRGIFAAIFPGLMIFALFFVDHNVSSIMVQSPKFKLKKPPAYHWDFFVLGLTMIPCGFLGIPPGNGLILQGPLHVRSLCKHEMKRVNGVMRESYSDCQEQRWSAFFQAALMFVVLSLLVVISWIPMGCLFGVYLYLGVVALYGNGIMERILYVTLQSQVRPPTAIVQNVAWKTTCVYTFLQAASGVFIFAIGHFSKVGYIFPALVLALVPVRIYIISYMFSEESLKYLDPHAETLANVDGNGKNSHDVGSVDSNTHDSDISRKYDKNNNKLQQTEHDSEVDDPINNAAAEVSDNV